MSLLHKMQHPVCAGPHLSPVRCAEGLFLQQEVHRAQAIPGVRWTLAGNTVSSKYSAMLVNAAPGG